VSCHPSKLSYSPSIIPNARLPITRASMRAALVLGRATASLILVLSTGHRGVTMNRRGERRVEGNLVYSCRRNLTNTLPWLADSHVHSGLYVTESRSRRVWIRAAGYTAAETVLNSIRDALWLSLDGQESWSFFTVINAVDPIVGLLSAVSMTPSSR
jgi:hypothetical protein